MTQPVLEIENLHLSFPGYKADVHALNHVSLHINRGEIVGVVGESGSGKSVTAMLAMRLLPEGSYRIHQGRVTLLGEDVLTHGCPAESHCVTGRNANPGCPGSNVPLPV